MPEKMCPICEKPYEKKKEFETTTWYLHPDGRKCEQLKMPGNPNDDESTHPSVKRRKP